MTLRLFSDETFMYFDGFQGDRKSAVLYYILETDWLVTFEQSIDYNDHVSRPFIPKLAKL